MPNVIDRQFYLGCLIAAVGWQMVSGETITDLTTWGIVLIGLGLTLTMLRWPFESKRLPEGLGLILALILVQFIVAGLARELLARVHEVPQLSWLLASIIELVGINTGVQDGVITFHTNGFLVEYNPTLSKFHAFVLIMFAASVLTMAVLMDVRDRLQMLAILLVVVAVYSLLKILATILIQPLVPADGLEISPWWMLVSLTPMIIFLPRMQINSGPIAAGFSAWARPAALLSCMAFTALWTAYEPAGARKPGRVLFDDAHGPWEPTRVEFNTENYGRKYTYTYSEFFRLLEFDYDVARLEQGVFDDTLLKEVDVLIIKTPTTRYQPDEIDAMERFVRAGGGLFVIGDHTNLFGMTEALNEVTERFDIRFRDDDTFDVVSGAPSKWRKSLWPQHPISAAVSEFEFETSSSIMLEGSGWAPILGYGLGSEPADYNNPGFFGDIRIQSDEDFGFFLQHVVKSFGNGRVAVFSDSTTLSNFSLFFPGRRELALATVEYLNHEASPLQWTRWVFAVVAFASLALLLALPRQRPWYVETSAMFAGFLLGAGVASAASMRLELPALPDDTQVVYIHRDSSHARFPSILVDANSEDFDGFDTFVMASQRLGYVPVVGDDLLQAFTRADIVILLHATANFTEEQRTAAIRFVTNGGAIFVADDLFKSGEATNEVLAGFGLSVRTMHQFEPLNRSIPDAEAPLLTVARLMKVVEGGTPILYDGEGRTIYAEAEIGAGRVGVLSASSTISRAALGNRFYDNPSDEQKDAYNTAYTILRRLAETSE